jgi:hypothetical protein
MPLTLRWGIVTAITRRVEGMVRAQIGDAEAVAYTRITGPVEEGDVVLVNTQARDLGIGSGGFDIVHANLTRGLGLAASDGAHVMVLPYASGQHAVAFAEEHEAIPERLEGLPVVCCGLHSQLAPVCAALKGARVAYIQLAGGALPVSLSDTVRALKVRKLLDLTIAVSPCFDADLHCVTVASALTVAAGRGVDVAVCGIGPGIVGTGTRFGHGGLVVADAANAAYSLGGRPIIAPRVSFGDTRERHQGLSQHTRAALELCLGNVRIAWPSRLEVAKGLEVTHVDVDGWSEACEGLGLSHMGRVPRDDPWFFACAFAAGKLARGLV